MKPVELFDLCADAITRWNEGDQIADFPTVMLVVPLTRLPRGDSIRLAGKSGPLGRLATIKEAGDAYEAVGFFNAVKVIQWMQKGLA
jgi:hypothetical protein